MRYACFFGKANVSEMCHWHHLTVLENKGCWRLMLDFMHTFVRTSFQLRLWWFHVEFRQTPTPPLEHYVQPGATTTQSSSQSFGIRKPLIYTTTYIIRRMHPGVGYD